MNGIIGKRLKDIVNGGETRRMLSRLFSSSSRSRAVNLRKINPRVSQQEAVSIAQSLYNVIKQNAPLSISNTWNLAKEGVVSGLSSKTHMKLMLKWMRGRAMLKQFCTYAGSNKKFLLTTLPEDPNAVMPTYSMEPKRQHKKRSAKKSKKP
ncbi:hypothetical protein Leryth_011236 [Lithospermum erythrorhizon]|nr:hypothetical protein Leryth_011236 [Lithospermum erythrorhizon]